ncbi:unnamed protein product [Cylicocyclus nassatus]|uniref:TIL domain-containing protein n=1 Tax=Cylicocyclus nassatus TaxID=53992 RepID=A0AA36DJ74_CYLNA|nr:unnamed protein product [Cylicocyclus nassatus]
MRLLHLVFIAFCLTLASARHNGHHCGVHEEYVECGSGCEPSCGNPKPHCNQHCVSGCQCQKGYFRNAHHQCVESCTIEMVETGCSAMSCSSGMHCEMAPKPCPHQPCQRAPTCVMNSPSPPPPPPVSCSQIQCPMGTACRMVQEPCAPGRACAALHPTCIAMSPPLPPPPPPRPLDCSQVLCAPGMVCQMVQRQCVRPPCHAPEPRCVIPRPAPSPPPTCATTRCPPGTHCDMVVQPCLNGRCPPPLPHCISHPIPPPPPPPPLPVLRAPPEPCQNRCDSHTHKCTIICNKK